VWLNGFMMKYVPATSFPDVNSRRPARLAACFRCGIPGRSSHFPFLKFLDGKFLLPYFAAMFSTAPVLPARMNKRQNGHQLPACTCSPSWSAGLEAMGLTTTAAPWTERRRAAGESNAIVGGTVTVDMKTDEGHQGCRNKGKSWAT
jgi:hypothetical protein